ncbi:MAG: cation:proton antiporter [Oscillospiraceae bacterium]|nr:cation:proton antiporter [Oscillospiraceae bacterium]
MKEVLTMIVLQNVAFALLAGLLMTRLMKKLHLPDVTAYLIAGLLIGPSLFGRLGIPGVGFSSFEEIEKLGLISDVALGFIAFSIGNEFRLSELKKTGRQAFVIGIFQAVVATLLVDTALLAFHLLFPEVLSVPAAITLGAIASATAPAATLMVVRQYKAKGELTKLLLPIVALDDAVGLILFAVSFGIARALQSGVLDIYSVLFNPAIEIAGSLLLGAVAGWLLTKLETLFHSNTNRLAMTIAFVFLTVALSMMKIELGAVEIGFSSLLVCMMLGTVFCNICPLSEDLMEKSDRWTAPLLVLFFVLSGAELELEVFAQGTVILIGVVYILVRSIGKYFGASVSAKATKCSPSVVKYLGITLLPQAGVALGMCVTAQTLGEDGPLIRNIILFAVLVYELVGPLMTKWALTKAGDIKPKSAEVENRRAHKLAQAEPRELLVRRAARKAARKK